ncbi:MAG: DUF4265 domain-containing protein [Thermoleophilia bacterium]
MRGDDASPGPGWVKILLPEPGYHETVWAWRVDDALYEIRSVPWFFYGVNHLDVVEAVENAAGQLEVVRVARPSGHRTYRLIVADEHVDEATIRAQRIRAAGGLVERFNDVFWAVDVPPGALNACVPLIEGGEADGIWEPEDATDPDA